MSSMCLSSVLTGANMAMYQTGISDILQQQLGVSNTQLGNAGFSSILSGKHRGYFVFASRFQSITKNLFGDTKEIFALLAVNNSNNIFLWEVSNKN